MKISELIWVFPALSTLAYGAPSSPGRFQELPTTSGSKHLRPVLERRQSRSGFADGEPFDGKGKGAPFSGGTNRELDLQNPDNLGQQSTDSGVVVNLKWSFSDSKTRLLNGGWTREQVVTDLPASKDIAAARGSIRELHWHRAEWGFVYAGQVAVSAVDENGRNQYEILNEGDIWYFPKGEAHTVQGLAEQNEYLLAFDDGDFDASGTTFMVDDWITHTPKDILARNFGVDASVFKNVPSPNPYITNATVSTEGIDSPNGKLEGNSSYVYHASQFAPTEVPGGGGTIHTVDSRNFPVAKTIAASIVTLKPGALRELHWHPNAEEWLYFVSGKARATVFIGGATARTFDFSAGDTAVFPDNAGHYVENTSNQTLTWIELYKSDRVVDISLTQWLALTPVPIVAQVLHVDEEVVRNLKKEKQVIIA
ncbi:Bicupin, oxalate decarboxylase/oxidase [Polychaeton citri CBS 116435]|uniref:Bicupin, oxalate decarboxylase/oxidase n=1 Tax=Polychaeton citri CBS 116435 TaxID=1314669 RepID=A0A9P4QA88_9PEZI|nr:Bicupin, oxalate decarboxylase/oxidase [Polychaeton citri CBS 116435]